MRIMGNVTCRSEGYDVRGDIETLRVNCEVDREMLHGE